jgi:hypothetical protein
MESNNNKGKRKKIDSEKITPFSNRKYYRYVDIPNNIKSDFNMLNLFFGDDRSYRTGCPFDNGDIIFEFIFKENNSGEHIDHHPLSYRGSLSKTNVTITNIFINRRNEDYYIVHHLIAYRKKIKELVKNINHEYQNKVNYFDILRERIDFTKLPKTGWWEDKWKGLIYDAVLSYS